MPLLRPVLLGALLLIAGVALAASEMDEAGGLVWQEQEIALPEPPRQETLLPIYVSAATDNHFFVDEATLSVGGDGVVRYVLVVVTPEGARNVTFEGMRCETRERRIYASGRADGAWSKSRNAQWSRIQHAYANRHHAALFLEYFCSGGAIVRNVDEARDALRRGGYATGSWAR